MMEEDRVMKTNYGVKKSGDDDVYQGDGIFRHWFNQVFCRKPRVLDVLCASSCPLWDGIKD